MKGTPVFLKNSLNFRYLSKRGRTKVVLDNFRKEGYVEMKLKEARMLFNLLRVRNAIEVRRHAWKDHPERGFSPLELIRLIKGKGVLQDNRYPSALPASFLWLCRDDNGRKTEIAILFERNDSGQLIMIVHAYRDVRE